MKNTRLFALILAILMMLTFAACDAAESPSSGDHEKDHEMAEAPWFEVGDSSMSNSGGDLKGEYEYAGDDSIDGNYSGGMYDSSEGYPVVTGEEMEPPYEEEVTQEEYATVGSVVDTQEEYTTVFEDPSDDATEETTAYHVEVDQNELIKTPFTRTEYNNLSTFSADVDTASYTYFRRLVNSGYSFRDLRNSGNVFRTEEFINYFRYEVPNAKENELFGVFTEMTPCPWTNGETMLFRLTLEAPEAPESAGNNLVFLIDVSGSMSSEYKLPLLKKAFSYLVGNLSANDTVSIVTYSGREEVVLDGCRGTNSSEIMNAINSLKASGSTNGEAGLTMAYQIAEKHMIAGGNNRIIMASDGDLNVGISSSSELKAYIEQKRDQGVYLSVLGFGMGNYKDDKMEALADNGNGVYYYIDGESEAEKVFGTDLMGTLYTVANDVKLQIEFNKESVESYRLIGYDNRVLENKDFDDDRKDAGEVGASHQVTVLYEIDLKAQTNGTAADTLMTLRVRYKDPGETLSKLNEYVLGHEIISTEPSAETSFIISVTELASLLRNKNYNGDITVKTIFSELDALELDEQDMVEFRDLVGELIDYTEPEQETAQPNNDQVAEKWSVEGLYLKCDNGSSMIIASGVGPCVMRANDNSVSFAGLTDGDKIRIEVFLIEETYPAGATVYRIEKLSDGERSDIPSDIMKELSEMGWIK